MPEPSRSPTRPRIGVRGIASRNAAAARTAGQSIEDVGTAGFSTPRRWPVRIDRRRLRGRARAHADQRHVGDQAGHADDRTEPRPVRALDEVPVGERPERIEQMTGGVSRSRTSGCQTT